MSSLRRRAQSLTTPEKTFEIEAVASAMPSMIPTVSARTPRTVTRKDGRRLWITSEEMSMKKDTPPSRRTVRGRRSTASGDLGTPFIASAAALSLRLASCLARRAADRAALAPPGEPAHREKHADRQRQRPQHEIGPADMLHQPARGHR